MDVCEDLDGVKGTEGGYGLVSGQCWGVGKGTYCDGGGV